MIRILIGTIAIALSLNSASWGQENKQPAYAERIRELAKKHRGKVAVAVKHLDNNESFHLDGDEVMPTASLIKFPVMLEVYMQALEGKIKLADMLTLRKEDMVQGAGILTYHFSDGASFSLRDAVRLMIVYSDNTATNMVLDRISIPATGKRMEAWGCANTKINAKVFRGSTSSIDPARTKQFGLGSTTAHEMVRLLEKTHRGELVSAAACKEMLEHMKKCDDATKIKRYLPKGTAVAHKTGSVTDVKTDAGIIYTPKGPVAICVLTANNADNVYYDDNEGNILIGRIAEAVFQQYAAKSR